MHSHHSHSGDYVSHASDTLETITAQAASMGFDTFCLTEHMPRLNNEFLYPEEIEKDYTVEDLKQNFASFYKHARTIQATKKLDPFCKTLFLVGLEVEGIDMDHIEYTKSLIKQYPVDMIVGSVHYVKQIPMDFSKELWNKAKDACGGTVYDLYKEYFELQYLVIENLKPSVIGHFDLVRLFLGDDDVDSRTGKLVKQVDIETEWPEIWALIIKCIKLVKSYGGLFELNSAAIRKGWASPYPQSDIARAINDNGGCFCLSDDSHSIAQVGLNYPKVLKYIKELGIKSIGYIKLVNDKPSVGFVSVTELESHDFWKQYI